jgi:plastocyanin
LPDGKNYNQIRNLTREADMKKSILFAGVMMVAMLLGTSYGFAAAADMAESPVVVTIEGSSFSPEVAIVKAGGEVIWKNKDNAPHTITADDGSFDSGTLAQGSEYRRKFTTPGTVKYSCDIHAYMSGKIEVR